MGIEVSQQLAAFLASWLLGALLGLLYDLLRSFRLAVRERGLSLVDGLYCLLSFAAVFYFTMTFGAGELRLYMVVGIFGGAVLALIYFAMCFSGGTSHVSFAVYPYDLLHNLGHGTGFFCGTIVALLIQIPMATARRSAQKQR